MKDWVIRTIKTFIQAFFGVLIPEICAMLNNGWPESWDKVWIILAPTIAAALSAAICAVWNIILEKLQEPACPTFGEYIPDKEDDLEASENYREQVEDYLAKH